MELFSDLSFGGSDGSGEHGLVVVSLCVEDHDIFRILWVLGMEQIKRKWGVPESIAIWEGCMSGRGMSYMHIFSGEVHTGTSQCKATWCNLLITELKKEFS